MNPKVYLAGPISQTSYAKANSWRDDLTENLARAGIEAISPLRGKHIFLAHAPKGAVEEIAANNGITPRQIVTRDLQDIAACDMVIANLLDIKANNEIVIGTPMEIFYAAHVLGLPVITLVNDAGSPWITHHSIRVCGSLEEAAAVAKMYFVREDVESGLEPVSP